MLLHLRRNAVAYLALFVALGGTSLAATKLAKNSVGRKQIKRGAVSNTKLANNAVTSGKVRNGSLVGKDFRSGTLLKGAKGERGPAGPSTGPAGGELAGSYPNPTIKPLGAWTSLPLGLPCFTGLSVLPPPHVITALWLPAGGFTAPSYRKDRDGVVHLRGSFQCSFDTFYAPTIPTVSVLPAGFRPSGKQTFAVTNEGATTADPVITVDSDGLVKVDNPGTGHHLSVDGVAFDSLH